jgi:fucose 4-O-acetylase-like acetyltransferase
VGRSVSHGQDSDFGLRGRIEWVDAAKGIGIFLVVFGHSLGGMIDSGMLKQLGVECLHRSVHLYFPHAAFLFPGWHVCSPIGPSKV